VKNKKNELSSAFEISPNSDLKKLQVTKIEWKEAQADRTSRTAEWEREGTWQGMKSRRKKEEELEGEKEFSITLIFFSHKS